MDLTLAACGTFSGSLPGLYDPGQPWEKWGCPIDGCGKWFPGPPHLPVCRAEV
jgi:hypothetical protein